MNGEMFGAKKVDGENTKEIQKKLGFEAGAKEVRKRPTEEGC